MNGVIGVTSTQEAVSGELYLCRWLVRVDNPSWVVPVKPSMLQCRSSWFLLKEILSRGGVGVLMLWGFEFKLLLFWRNPEDSSD